MAKKEISDYKILFYIAITAAIMLAFPQIIRILDSNNTLIGEQPYYHARLAEKIIDQKMMYEDNLIYGGRELKFTPYHFLIAGLGYLLNVEMVLRFLPFLFGIASAVIFYLVLRRFENERLATIFSVIILISSPIFIFTFTSMQDSMSIFLSILAAYLMLRKSRLCMFFASLLFIIVSLFSIFNALVIIVPVLLYSFFSKKHKRLLIMLISILILVYLAYSMPLFYKLSPSSNNFFNDMVSDAGGLLGFGIFSVLLAIIGIAYSWERKKEYYPAYITLIMFIVLFFFAGNYVNIYVNFLVSFFAGLGLSRIKQINWRLKMIRNLTFLIIACGILFSMMSYSARIADMPPDGKIINALDWLKSNSRQDDVVISHYSNGYYIEYFAVRPVLIDSYEGSMDDFNARYIDIYSLFQSNDISTADRIIGKYGAKYILITREMKEGLVWETKDQGILYLFRNNETFKNIYNSDNIEIWKYLKKV